jgi:cytochrome d ubiquinol oxidase subunit II
VTAELAVAGVMLAALVVYTLTGGADFGGGVWDLLASGPRAEEQRKLIARTLAPIWEANHVWLILIIVLMFVGFPPVFAAVTTALHVPLSVMLVGIVLRGSAFTFRAYDLKAGAGARRWRRVFEVASLITPVTLGVTLGALGHIRVNPAVLVEGGCVRMAPALPFVLTDFVSEWWAAFPLAVGGFTLAVCAYLAAVYLANEADDAELAEVFRVRALISAVAVGVTALLAFSVSAPHIQADLTASAWAGPLHAATGVAAVAAIGLLWVRTVRGGAGGRGGAGDVDRARLGAGAVSGAGDPGADDRGVRGAEVGARADARDSGDRVGGAGPCPRVSVRGVQGAQRRRRGPPLNM